MKRTAMKRKPRQGYDEDKDAERELQRTMLTRYPMGLCPVTGEVATEVHHVMHHRGHSTHVRPVIHSFLNCLLLSPRGHKLAHASKAIELDCVVTLVRQNGFWATNRYYEDAAYRTEPSFLTYLYRLGATDELVTEMQECPDSDEAKLELIRLFGGQDDG